MGRAQPTADPALQRLREVADRIRRRAAEGRERPVVRAPRPKRAEAEPPPPAAPLPEPPRHWSDGPWEDADDLH